MSRVYSTISPTAIVPLPHRPSLSLSQPSEYLHSRIRRRPRASVAVFIAVSFLHLLQRPLTTASSAVTAAAAAAAAVCIPAHGIKPGPPPPPAASATAAATAARPICLHNGGMIYAPLRDISASTAPVPSLSDLPRTGHRTGFIGRP